MPDAKFTTVLERTLERTQDGALQWKETDDPDTFVLSLTDATLMLVGATNSVFFRVLTTSGSELGRLQALTDPKFVNEDWERHLVQLYDLVRRRSLRIDETLDSVLEELGE